MIRRIYSKREKRHVWSIDLTIAGERIRHSGYLTKSEAEEAAAGYKLRHRAQRDGLSVSIDVTLRDLYERWKETPIAHTGRTASSRIREIEIFADGVGWNAQVKSIRAADLRRYQSFLAQSVQPGSVATYLSYITQFLNSARLLFPELDDYRAPLVPQLQGKTIRSRVLAKNELAAIIREIQAPSNIRRNLRPEKRRRLVDLILLLLLTGARVGELLALRPGQIDLDKGLLTIKRTKTGTVSIIPLGNLGREIIASLLPRLFEGLKYPAILPYLERASESAGIPYGARVENGWKIHDLRHTVASLLAEEDINDSVIAELLGHKKSGTTGRVYTHATMTALRKAVQHLEKFCQDLVGGAGNFAQIEVDSSRNHPKSETRPNS